jgi:3-hydroxyacyl-CoA dehydrogenase
MCNKDIPGFIANGVMMFPLNFVGQLIDQGKFKIEEIDSAMHFNIGMRMAVFGLLDFVGIDVTYNILKFMATRIKGMTLAKCLEDRVKRGDLGVKTGKGFYEYPTGRWAVPASWSPSLAGKFDPQFVTSVAINRAAALVDDKVATPADIDKTLKLGFNLPLGMLEIADSLGIDTIVGKLEHIAEEYDQFYTPHALLRKMVKEGKLGRKSGEGFFKY